MKTNDKRPSPRGADHDPALLARRHTASIEAIAQELELPIDEVVPHYEAVLRELAAEARIGDYLPILVAKRLRAQYRRTTGVR